MVFFGGKVSVSWVVTVHDDGDVGENRGITIESFNSTERSDQRDVYIESFAYRPHDEQMTETKRLSQDVHDVQRQTYPGVR